MLICLFSCYFLCPVHFQSCQTRGFVHFNTDKIRLPSNLNVQIWLLVSNSPSHYFVQPTLKLHTEIHFCINHCTLRQLAFVHVLSDVEVHDHELVKHIFLTQTKQCHKAFVLFSEQNCFVFNNHTIDFFAFKFTI